STTLPPPKLTLFPYTTLFRSQLHVFCHYSRMAVCREIWFWPMRCKAHATYPGIQLSNGLLILRTTGPLVHSTCSGNFISWRKSTCATAARKLVGSWKTGDSFSKQLQTTIRRSLAGSTGLRRNGYWKHSSSPKG